MPAEAKSPREASEIDDHTRDLAIAKLAELLQPAAIPWGELDWLNVKHDVRVSARGDSDALLSKTGYLVMIKGAFGNKNFPHWLGDLLSLFAQSRSYHWYPYGDNRVSQARRDIVAGKHGWSAGKRALVMLGYECVEGKTMFDEPSIVLLPSTGSAAERQQVDKLRAALGQRHPSALTALQSAYENFQSGGADGNRQACEAARNALENLVRDVTSKDLGPGIDELSPDDEKRRRLFKDLRDTLSVWGPHGAVQPKEADVYLSLRMTEQAMIWILKGANEW